MFHSFDATGPLHIVVASTGELAVVQFPVTIGHPGDPSPGAASTVATREELMQLLAADIVGALEAGTYASIHLKVLTITPHTLRVESDGVLLRKVNGQIIATYEAGERVVTRVQCA